MGTGVAVVSPFITTAINDKPFLVALADKLNNAKLSLKNTILNLNNTSFDRNTSLSYNLDTPYGIFKDNEAFKIIDSITEEDILNTANYIFSDKPIYSIVATENTLKANESYLRSL